MITQELVAYIRAQQANGKTEEEIRASLASGGWAEDDLKSAFKIVTPSNAPPVPQSSQSQIVQTIVPLEANSFTKKTYFLFGLFFWLLIMAFGSYFVFTTAGAIVSTVAEFIIPLGIVLLLIFISLGVFILNKVAKIFKSPDPSWQKAFFVIGIWVLINMTLFGIQHATNLMLLSLVLWLITFAIQLIIFMRVYKFSLIKAFLVFIISSLCILLVVALIGLTTSILSATLESARQKGVAMSSDSTSPAIVTTATETTPISIQNNQAVLANQYYSQGVQDYNQKQYAKAITDFTQAIDNAPTNSSVEDTKITANIYLHRGMAKRDNNDIKGAIDDATKAITLDLSNKLAYSTRGGFYLIDQNNKNALSDFKSAISLDPQDTQEPNNGSMYLTSAAIEMSESQKTEACADFQQIKSSETAEFTPDLATVYHQLQTVCK
jgi:hypothetical protein